MYDENLKNTNPEQLDAELRQGIAADLTEDAGEAREEADILQARADELQARADALTEQAEVQEAIADDLTEELATAHVEEEEEEEGIDDLPVFGTPEPVSTIYQSSTTESTWNPGARQIEEAPEKGADGDHVESENEQV